MVKSYEEYLEELPLMISFPRSGCNWLQSVMELYFDRHRAGKVKQSPTWMTSDFKDPLWCHSHDHGGAMIKTDKKVIYLWRNPIDTVYSLCRLNNTQNENSIKNWCREFKNLHNKWTKDEHVEERGTNDVLVIKYEDVLENPHKEMEKISNFFDVPFDLERSKMAFETVGGKKSVNTKEAPKNDPNLPNAGGRFKNEQSHTKEYEDEREQFRWLWGDFILNEIGFEPK